ncbi:MAG: hypothetical protein H0V46_03700 [Sphingomonas sp.]|nr:hypothetical protein [Sphingomonas sp.]
MFAALTFVRAARSLTSPGTLVPLLKRIRRGQHQAQATRVALAVELLGLLSAALVLAAILSFLWWAGQVQIVILSLLFAPALLAKSLAPLLVGRAFGQVYRPTVAMVGLALIGAGALLSVDITIFAMLFAARVWLALVLSYAIATPIDVDSSQPVEELHWREIADSSHMRARKQAAYRFSKAFLAAFLGPFGSMAARTGRGMQMDRKAERFVPSHPAVLGLVAAAGTGISAALVLGIPEPALLFVAATLLRVSAAAATILLWSALSSGASVDAEFDDDHDDE